MALSYVRYTGDGSTQQYAINFTLGFLSRGDVHVYVDDIEVSFTWITDGLINVTTTPVLGAAVLIRRIVDKTTLVHDYEDGAVVVESNLDDSNKQSLMASHEVTDGFLAPDGGFNTDVSMHGYRITNVGTPVDSNDAVHKDYVDSTVPANVLAAQESADDSAASALESSGFADDSAASALESSGFADDSATSAAAALLSEETTVLYAGQVTGDLLVADLLLIEGSNGQLISTSGRTAIGDGGGGTWVWDSSNLSTEVTADTESGIYVAPTSDATGASVLG